MNTQNIDFSQFRSIGDIICDLKKPIALKHIEVRRQGGKEIPFVSWSRVCDYLDYYAMGWSYEVCKTESVAGKYIMTVRITIPAKEGLFYREATGQEDETTDSWGDSSSNAESMALRRAAAKFGVAKYLYDISDQERAGLSRNQQVSFSIPKPVRVGDTVAQNAPELPETAHTSDLQENAPESDVKPQSDAEQVEVDPLIERIAKAFETIEAFSVKPFERKKGESNQSYLERLIKQYKAIKATPSVLTDEERNESKKNDNSGTVTIEQGEAITGAQIETLELLLKRSKQSMIDVVQQYTEGRGEVLEDMMQTEADAAIAGLSQLLQEKAKVKAK